MVGECEVLPRNLATRTGVRRAGLTLVRPFHSAGRNNRRRVVCLRMRQLEVSAVHWHVAGRYQVREKVSRLKTQIVYYFHI